MKCCLRTLYNNVLNLFDFIEFLLGGVSDSECYNDSEYNDNNAPPETAQCCYPRLIVKSLNIVSIVHGLKNNHVLSEGWVQSFYLSE